MMYRNARQARTSERIAARKKVQQGAHSLVLSVQGDRTTNDVARIAARMVHRWEDLRRWRLSPYGALLWFIDLAVALGTPKPVLKQIPALLDWYIEDSFDPTNTGELKLVA